MEIKHLKNIPNNILDYQYSREIFFKSKKNKNKILYMLLNIDYVIDS